MLVEAHRYSTPRYGLERWLGSPWLFQQPVFLRCKKCWTLTDEIRYVLNLQSMHRSSSIYIYIYVYIHTYICACVASWMALRHQRRTLQRAASDGIRQPCYLTLRCHHSSHTPFIGVASPPASHHTKKGTDEQLDRILRLSFSNDY